MPNLSLRLFGGFYAALDGEPISNFETDKVRALLAYLAVEADRPHARSTLATLLWADYPDANARTTLRHVLHLLRNALPDPPESNTSPELPYLLISRQALQFNPAKPIEFDVAQFLGLLKACAQHTHTHVEDCDECAARLRQAVDLYRGDFLSEFAVHDSAPFEEWRRLKQEQLHIQMLDALHILAAHAETRGHFEQARRYALRQVELEPWREEAHQQLMRSLAQSGQRTAALAQYAACRRILTDELGVEPSPQTVALYEQIRDQNTQASATAFVLDQPNGQHQPLAVPLTSFVGRHNEIQSLNELMMQARLITLTGPGGCGKSRLALEVASAVRSRFDNGVCWVDMASLTDPALLPQAVASALGQTGNSDADAVDAVAAYVQFKSLLLILDNCEHMITACAAWSRRWLSACPNLKILATSRESMNLEGERVWPVAALSIPVSIASAELAATSISPEASLDELLSFEAIQLFVGRAREIKPGFALTSANATSITQICQRLEGLPLAIELAAARINLLSPTEIATRLTQRLDPIVTANRATSPRHQTLRAAIGWSYDLLSAPEQILFRRLAIFSGGFTVDAAEAVVDLPNTLDLLSRLVDKSLLLPQTGGEQTRYRMLEVIREFAQSKLSELYERGDQPGIESPAEETHRLHGRAIAYFLQLAEHTATSTESDGEAAWLQPDADNFRAAIDQALARQDWDAGIRLISALSWYWWMRGSLSLYQEPVRRHLSQLNLNIDAAGTQSPRFVVAAGITLAMWGKTTSARQFLEHAVNTSKNASASRQSHYDPATTGLALRILASIAIQQKDFVAANDLIERSIAIWRNLGGMWHVGWLLSYQGDLALLRGDGYQAWAAYETSSQLPISPGARAYPLRQMAWLALSQGHFVQAAALCRESLTLNLELGDQQGLAACLACQAGIGIAYAQHLPEGVRFQTLRRSAQLLGAVTSLLSKLQSQLLHRDQIAFEDSWQRLLNQLGRIGDANTFEIARTEGRTMVTEQAIALALQDTVSEDPAALDPTHSTSFETASELASDSVSKPAAHHPDQELRRDLRRDLREMPSLPTVRGRNQEIHQIQNWLEQDQCRLVAVLGMGGVGKTTVAAQVVQMVADQFEFVVWCSLVNSPELSEVLRNWLQTLSGQTLTEWPQSTREQIRLLLSYLNEHRCLLVLDNFESLLKPGAGVGELQPGYEDYAQLLQRVASGNHHSALMLTSREQPQVLARLLRPAGPVRLLSLQGLSTTASQAILQAHQLTTSPQQAVALNQHYSGNPLALQIVANTIVDMFDGDVAAFQREDMPVFGDVRAVLHQQFERLSELEYDILIWLAIERAAVTPKVLSRNLVQHVAPHAFVEALQALKQRSLLEQRPDPNSLAISGSGQSSRDESNSQGITLQNVVMEYATEALIQAICEDLAGSASLPIPSPVTSPLNRYAILKAQSQEYARQSQARLIVQPIADRLRANLGEQHLRARLHRRLADLRTEAERIDGYTAGNILNLILHLGWDPSEFDFSRLAVWQADLRRATQAAINFEGADLSHSAFTLSFDLATLKMDASGAVMLAGAVESDLCLWRVAEGRLNHAFRQPLNVGHPIIFSNHGNLLAHGTLEFQICISSSKTGQVVQLLQGHTDRVYGLAFSPDDRLIASSGRAGRVCLWDIATGQLVQQFTEHGHVIESLAFSPDGKYLAGSSDRVVVMWDIASGQMVRSLGTHAREVTCLAFSPDGRFLISGTHNGTIYIWDAISGDPVRTLTGHRHIVRRLLFHPHEPILASSSADRTARLWNLDTGQLTHTLLGHQDEITSLSFSSDGNILASGSVDRTLMLWDTRNGRALDVLQGHFDTVRSVQFNASGTQLASCSADGKLRLWELQATSERDTQGYQNIPPPVVQWQAHHASILSVVFSPDGGTLASASADHTVRLWDVATRHPIGSLVAHHDAVRKVAFSPDGTLLATGSSDYTVRLWQISSLHGATAEASWRVLQGHEDDVVAVSFSPDGRTVLSGSLDHTARLWDVQTGQPIRVWRDHISAGINALFSPDGCWAFVNSWDLTLRIWDVVTDEQIRLWNDDGPGAVKAIGFTLSPDGTQLATVTPEQTIEIRELPSGRLLNTLRGQAMSIMSLDFDPSAPADQKRLASSDWGGLVQIWDVNTGQSVRKWRAAGPYAGMNIAGVTGMTEVQKNALKALGASVNPVNPAVTNGGARL